MKDKLTVRITSAHDYKAVGRDIAKDVSLDEGGNVALALRIGKAVLMHLAEHDTGIAVVRIVEDADGEAV